MAFDAAEGIGFVAGGISSFASLPQAFKIWRERDASEVSTKTYLLMLAGATLWIGYGLLRGSPAITVWNSVWFLNSAGVMALKLFFNRAPLH